MLPLDFNPVDNHASFQKRDESLIYLLHDARHGLTREIWIKVSVPPRQNVPGCRVLDETPEDARPVEMLDPTPSPSVLNKDSNRTYSFIR